jgi:hypothetical protein
MKGSVSGRPSASVRSDERRQLTIEPDRILEPAPRAGFLTTT